MSYGDGEQPPTKQKTYKAKKIEKYLTGINKEESVLCF
jgi:hypothetical protein